MRFVLTRNPAPYLSGQRYFPSRNTGCQGSYGDGAGKVLTNGGGKQEHEIWDGASQRGKSRESK